MSVVLEISYANTDNSVPFFFFFYFTSAALIFPTFIYIYIYKIDPLALVYTVSVF